MDVFSIGSGNAPKAPEGGSVDRTSSSRGESRVARAAKSSSGDVYATSSEAHRVADLLERLRDAGDAEPTEVIESFRALLEAGELDTPAAASRAVDGLLRGGI